MSVRLDHGDDGLAEVHEINVTPFIDVMLVLLIIFMVAAPLATVDIAVNLPASTAEPQPRPDKPLFLTVKARPHARARRTIRCRASSLRSALDAAAKGDKEHAHLPARRQGRALRRADGGDEPAAQGGLSQGRAGRAGKGAGAMIGFTAEDLVDLRRWAVCAAVVVLTHGGIAAAMVNWRDADEAAEPAAAIVLEFAPVPVAPAMPQMEIPPGPEQVMSDASPNKPTESVEDKIEDKVEQKAEAKLEQKVEEKVDTKPLEEPPPEVAPAPDPEVAIRRRRCRRSSRRPRNGRSRARRRRRRPRRRRSPSRWRRFPRRPRRARSFPPIPTWCRPGRRRSWRCWSATSAIPRRAQSRREQGVAQVFFSLDRTGARARKPRGALIGGERARRGGAGAVASRAAVPAASARTGG